MFENVSLFPAVSRPDLLAPSVLAGLAPIPDALVFEIDPSVSDTAACSAAYGFPMSIGANAVLVGGKREGVARQACCLTLAHRRVDVNGYVRSRLGVRKASFLPMDEAVAASGMEYGAITPVGLPDGWAIWVDGAVADTPSVVIGAGLRRAKLVVPGTSLLALPGAERVDDLARDLP